MINAAIARGWSSGDVAHHCTPRDAILYALGLNAGANGIDDAALQCLYEAHGPAVLPTMACVMASPGSWMRSVPGLGIDFGKLLHGEQCLEVHAPLPAEGVVIGRSRVVRLVDKGVGKGALMHVERQLFGSDGSTRLATIEQTLFLRGDGGFSGGDAASDPPAPAPEAMPDREPDMVLERPTSLTQALLYRLSGDLNPLHADPAIARAAGFHRPILHGLATFGMAGLAATDAAAAGHPHRVRALRARFTSPVYPGERLRFSFWRCSDTRWAFRCHGAESGRAVLDHGWLGLASTP